jgi:hypothetical protein
MTRGVGWSLVGSLVLLAVLVGCGRVYLAQRDSWRREAELACLKSGSVKDGAAQVRIEPIHGPGVCGADFPLKVAALGESAAIGFARDLRPPAAIPNAPGDGQGPRWPVIEPRYAPPAPPPAAMRTPPQGAVRPVGEPISLAPPGLAPPPSYEPLPRGIAAPPTRSPVQQRPYGAGAPAAASPGRYEDDDIPDDAVLPDRSRASAPRTPGPSRAVPLSRGPARVPLRTRMTTGAIGPVTVKPTATLACPIVSALDQWVGAAVQPAAMRWFGQPVTEIKQISAYSCRGMNGNPRARISEHAFGNALDIAAFILADGRKVTIKDGWRGSPEEQGFLHDVQLAACEQFTTVLAPGSNRFHYDHIHVDLMRRASGRRICQPAAIPGEVAAARAGGRNLARRGDPGVTGSIAKAAGKAKPRAAPAPAVIVDDDEDAAAFDDDEEPRGPGND